MWPFKRRSPADRALSVRKEAEALVCEKWIYFNSKLAFKQDVEFKEQFSVFLFPMIEGLRNSYLELEMAPDTVLTIYITRGVAQSSSHSKAYIAEKLKFPIEVLED